VVVAAIITLILVVVATYGHGNRIDQVDYYGCRSAGHCSGRRCCFSWSS
jgi:hypothetical protein